MAVLYLGLTGLLVFALGALILGAWLRRHPSRPNAEKSSRVMHFLFFAGLGVPFPIAIFYPGLSRLDPLVGLEPLPWRPFFLIAGILLAIPGLYLLAASNKSLRALGSGANAFRLTKRIVENDVYTSTRNPMSLGYYLLCLAIAFVSGSSLLTLAVLLGVIPAHLLFLKYFEEKELELRFGDAYREYRSKVPFLIPKLSRD
jgi:protein-S-isoprenylcysteine O-methyltransferase Ste14